MSPKQGNTSTSTYLRLFLCLLLAGFSLSACAIKRPGPLKDTLRVNLGSEPPSLDWHLATDYNSFDVMSNLMVGLTQFKQDLSCVPACASSWEILDGGSKYVFHLRSDAKWTDGKHVTAQDFQYSWTRLLDPKTAAPYAFFLYDVKNAFEFNTGKIKDPKALGLYCPDERTFVVQLKRPASYFLNISAMCATYPLRKDCVEKHGNRWTEPENIIVNGPFIMRDWKHEYKIELDSNQNYFEGQAKIKHIKMFMVPEQATAYALYQSDQLDFLDNRSLPTPDIAQVSKSSEYENVELLKTDYVGFNVRKKPFDDPRVRLAFSMGIDRSVFPKILRRQEKPVANFIPEGLSAYKPGETIKFDPQKARQLLAQAGYPDGRGFPQVEILYPSREDARLVVEELQDQFKRNLNIQLPVSNQEFKVYMNALHRDPPPIFRANWGADFPDPETFASVFVSHNSNNHTLWTNPEYDRLVQAAEGEQDQAKRNALYQEADHLLCMKEAAVACTFRGTENTMRKPWIKNVRANALDLFFYKDAEIDNDWHE